MRRYHALYKLIDNGGVCIYCGVRANTKDHFVPISVVNILKEVIDDIQGLFLVPCCSECNSLAGAAIFNTVAKKRRFIQVKIRIKYKHLLALPRWEQQEIDELGPGLKTSLLSALARKQWIEERLTWRNNFNQSAVEIVKIRSELGIFGKSFAARNANSPGITNSVKSYKKKEEKVYNKRIQTTQLKDCLNCGKRLKQFSPTRSKKQKFCSKSCSGTWHYKQNREERLKLIHKFKHVAITK